MTNLDNIRQMNSEELADFLSACTDHCECCIATENKDVCEDVECVDGIKAWLEQEITPTLTDDEKVILRKVKKHWNKIGRKIGGALFLGCAEGSIDSGFEDFFENVFDWIDEGKEYEISKLLGE